MPVATTPKTFRAPPTITSFAPTVTSLGPWQGRYNPSYQVIFYREGDPRKVIGAGEVNLETIVSIETAKNISNISGTWSITLKDARAEHAIQEMDVVVIRLKGHNQPLTSVLHGLVDEVGKEGTAEPESAQENTVITGRCLGKYLQVNSLFLPVWEPEGLLPTALTFGLGDSSEKAGANVSVTVPKEIFGYIFRRYIVGDSKHVGISGTPAAAHWINKDTRFEEVKVKDGSTYHVPYIQFDENTTDQALSALTITGFTEGWIDEFGYVVYRPPGWDLPVNYILSTDGLISDKLVSSDVGMATYVEVVPSGAVGISTAAQQATAAGRAPVPSNYLTSESSSQTDTGKAFVSPEFVIDANSRGEVTKKGQSNYWYKRQRKFGLRPYQVSSPLLVSQAQAQMQAEGLLKFLGNRLQKTGTVTIPGEPKVRLGTTILIKGALRGKKIERTYFIEGIRHEYVDGHGYSTTLELTHGRDPWDPEWKKMVLPANPAILAETGGVSTHNTSFEGESPASGGEALVPGAQAKQLSDGSVTIPTEAPRQVQKALAAANQIRNKPYVYGGGHGQSLSSIQSSYDCSSSCSYILHAAGLLGDSALVSGEFESYGDAGAGQWITIFANGGHMFMRIAGIWYDHGPVPSLFGSQPQSTSGFTVRHPKGF
jgi:hypothetical protein